jgi:ribosome-associated protein
VKLESVPIGVRLAVQATQEKKAGGITVLDLRDLGAFTQYFIICTGFSTPQVQAICTGIEEQLHKHAQRSPEHREGQRSAEWALLDFGSFVVHVFSEQARRYYDLERLWRSAPKLEIPDSPQGLGHDRAASRTADDPKHFPGEAVS